MTAQLPLNFPHRPDYAPEDFIASDSNAEARAFLAAPDDWPNGRLALWGDAGCGKTHLLRVWAGRTPAALAIDDADAEDEHALLHRLNEAREDRRPVLLAARPPPARWGTALPDLASRLRATTAVCIAPPDDGLLRALLARLLAERQMLVPAAVQDWLLLRLPRTYAALRAAAEALDRAQLASGTRVTRAMAAHVLGVSEEAA